MPSVGGAEFAAWSIAAVNLPEHADNPVHTLEGGLAAGYNGAVVAGTTVLSYLTRPVAQAWGAEWVASGGYEVWFRSPVLADEQVVVAADRDGVAASVGDLLCARLDPVGLAEVATELLTERPGKRLEPMMATMNDQWVGYAARGGEDLALYDDEGIVHPVVWPSLANQVFADQLIDGSWVHTRSKVAHVAAVKPGDDVLVEAIEVNRFDTRAGERAVVDVRFSVAGAPVCVVEHEAIVRLNES